MRRGLAAGTVQLLALERLLTARGELGLWEEMRIERPGARECEPVPVVAGGDDQPA